MKYVVKVAAEQGGKAVFIEDRPSNAGAAVAELLIDTPIGGKLEIVIEVVK